MVFPPRKHDWEFYIIKMANFQKIILVFILLQKYHLRYLYFICFLRESLIANDQWNNFLPSSYYNFLHDSNAFAIVSHCLYCFFPWKVTEGWKNESTVQFIQSNGIFITILIFLNCVNQKIFVHRMIVRMLSLAQFLLAFFCS